MKYKIKLVQGYYSNTWHYIVEKKHWFFGWEYISSSSDKTSVGGYNYHKTIEDAKHWIDIEGWKKKKPYFVYYDPKDKQDG